MTPPGDKAAGPRGPSAPGSGNHLKGELFWEPELGLAQGRECAGRGFGGERTPAGSGDLRKGGLLASSGGSRVGDLGYGIPQGRTPSGFVNSFLVEFN